MKYALLSDIHGNLPALEAVLDDIRRKGIPKKRTVCLGDMIGYGPFPRECVNYVREECGVVLAGNHECAAVHPDRSECFIDARHDYNRLWTLGQLGDDEITFIRKLPFTVTTPLFIAAHAMPHGRHDVPIDYVIRYVFMHEKGNMTEQMTAVYTHLKEVAQDRPSVFVAAFGHTHEGILVQPGRVLFKTDTVCSKNHGPVLCGVPSCGRPRGDDKRAGWAEVSEEKIMLHRVAYDTAKTQRAYRERSVPFNSDF